MSSQNTSDSVKCYTLSELRHMAILLEEGQSCRERLVLAFDRIAAQKSLVDITTQENARIAAENIKLINDINANEMKMHKLQRGRFVWLGVGIAGGLALYHFTR